jgi:hypothetical protein
MPAAPMKLFFVAIRHVADVELALRSLLLHRKAESADEILADTLIDIHRLGIEGEMLAGLYFAA